MNAIAKTDKTIRNGWKWVPTLYFAEGIPYTIVTVLSVLMYKRFGLDNTDVALYTSWLYLPWVIKPFWSPIVDVFRTKRWWILAMQFFLGISMAGVAFTIHAPHFVQWTLALFWLMAFSSATHDISADGFYMIPLTPHAQTFFVGIRSTAYKLGTFLVQGPALFCIGRLEIYFRDPKQVWSITFLAGALVFVGLLMYHAFALPHPKADRPSGNKDCIQNIWQTIVTFFQKPYVVSAVLFMLLFRLPEAFLVKICPMFLIDPVEEGGLELATMQLGLVQGTMGWIGLVLGGILGGIAISSGGFKRWLWPMVAAISIPDVVYIILAYFQPTSIPFIASCIFIEQFGYGFGFTAYMVFLIYFAQGASKTAHYAFCTGIMALGMMLPGMVAGWLQEQVGYLNFFIIVVVAFIPFTVLASAIVHIDDDFGVQASEEEEEEDEVKKVEEQ